MSIAVWRELETLKKRVEALEQAAKAETVVTLTGKEPDPPHPTLTLPNKGQRK